MTMRNQWIFRGGLAAGILLLSAAAGLAQMDQSDFEILTEQGQAEEWTFDVGRNSVTHRPLEEICTLTIPVDWEVGARFEPFLPPETAAVALPPSWDWRAYDGCTPVKNQGGCGSCWAFGTVGALECAIRISDGLTTDLSEQYLVSCNTSGYGCSGGWFAHSYHYDRVGSDGGGIGAVLETSKPYSASDAACGGPYAHPYQVNSWAYVGSSGSVPSVAAIKQAIMTYGPVSVAVYVNNAFQAYRSGVFNGCANGTVNHAVVLVGWNDAQQAWILRNSWGSGWGESGYMRIRYGCSRVGYGACFVDYGGGNPAPYISSPAPGGTLAGISETFEWDAAEGATEYWLSVGTTVGKGNVYSASQGTDTSVTIDRLPTDGKPVHVKLFARIGGQWFGRLASYKAANIPSAAAAMISPENGSTLDGGPVTFTWDTGSRVTQYRLWIGTIAGTSNLYNVSQGLNTSVTLSNLPTHGKPLYVRLWSRVGNTWLKRSYTYMAASVSPEAAQMISPADGSTLESSSATFTWNTGTGAMAYWIKIGTAPGGWNLLNRSLGTALSTTVNGLPTTGQTIYVRLWSRCNGTWQYNDYSYVTPNLVRGAAEITSPENGATLESQTETFAWNEGVGVTQYWLLVGTKPGAGNVYNKTLGLATSATVSGLPTNGQPVYVRLCSRIAGVLQRKDYVYTTATMAAAAAEMISPEPGSLLTSSLVTFTWSEGAAVAEYKLAIGTTLGGTNLYNKSLGTATTATVPNLPTSGQAVYVRLWSRIGTTWQKKDYIYRAVPSETSPAAQITSPVNGSKFTSTSVTFSWTAGTGATEYYLRVGTTLDGGELLDRSVGTLRAWTVSGLPTTGQTIYVRLSSLCYGVWEFRDYTYKAKGP